jgi:DNA-binding protein H-NS
MTTNIEDLDKQINELVKQKQKLIDEQRTSKLNEAKAIVKQFGFTASDLGIVAGTNKKAVGAIKATLEAKYANPNDSSLTWHGGRGAKPKWVNEFIENGGKLEDIEIKK